MGKAPFLGPDVERLCAMQRAFCLALVIWCGGATDKGMQLERRTVNELEDWESGLLKSPSQANDRPEPPKVKKLELPM